VRWRGVNLSVCLLWVVFGAWSVWDHFDPPTLVKAGLLACSLWLLLVGIVMQLIPERKRARPGAAKNPDGRAESLQR